MSPDRIVVLSVSNLAREIMAEQPPAETSARDAAGRFRVACRVS